MPFARANNGEELPGDAKNRNVEKISMIRGLDPFLGPLEECVEVVPPVKACDLASYLVLQITAKQFS